MATQGLRKASRHARRTRHGNTSRLDRICEAAAVKLGREMKPDESQLRADYDLTLREIVLRLRAEKGKANSPSTEAARPHAEAQSPALQR